MEKMWEKFNQRWLKHEQYRDDQENCRVVQLAGPTIETGSNNAD